MPRLKSLLAALLLTLALPANAEPVKDMPPVHDVLKPYLGKFVYVDFWASWCTPCAASFPWLNQMQQRYGDRIQIVAVGVDEDDTAAKRFLKRHPSDFAVLRDPSGALAQYYSIPAMPTALILDTQGRVIHSHGGFEPSRAAEYESAIRDAIASAGDTP